MSEQPDNSIDNELLHIFVHDIKVPLSAIKGCMDLIEQLGELNDAQKNWLDRSMGSINRIETIVHNMLDYSRLNEDVPIDREPFDLKQLIDDVVELFATELTRKQIQIQVDVDAKLQDVLGDENLLTHVLQNVLGNAIKYNKLNGKIWVTVSEERAYVRVDIRDTGMGIAAEDQNKIFKKYYRGKIGDSTIKGNGLGLSIAQMIVEKHQGLIWVNSQLDQGSIFSFTIPRERDHGTGSASDSGIRTALRGFNIVHHETAYEPSDDVDDDTQETIERGEDSPKDEFEL